MTHSADQNLGDLITAVRDREVGYAARVAAWGIFTLPIASLRAVRRRSRDAAKPLDVATSSMRPLRRVSPAAWEPNWTTGARSLSAGA